MAIRTGGEIAGLAVVSEGERLGRVRDVLFAPNGGGRVTGFLVDAGGGVFGKPKFLPRLMVRSLGADAVVVEPGTTLEDVDREPVVDSVAARAVDDRPVIDETGKFLGKVADIAVDDATLTVSALIVASGFFDNLLHGKPRLPLEQVKAFGGDSIVASSAFDPRATAAHAA
jgi:uncharacterized protein YrrD